jgi:hypothetical protein
VARAGLAGPAAAFAVCAATAGLAFDGGGFGAVSWDRALVLFVAAAFAVLVVAGAERPAGLALATVAALALLTAWTAASWAWSDAPAAAPTEAQRVGVYLAAALAVVAVGRRVALRWPALGVAAAVVPVALWNLALRVAPDWTGRPPLLADIGSLADPVGYANALAMLDAGGILLLLGVAAAERRAPVRLLAAALLVPLAADLGLLQSTGALAALFAGVAALLLASPTATTRLAAVLLPLPALALAAATLAPAVVSPPPADLLSAAKQGHRLLLGVALLAAAQAALARSALPALARRGRDRRLSGRAAALAAAGLAALGLVLAPVALRGHDRSYYWRAAAHEIAARPLLGGGAGSYATWWVRTRSLPLTTTEAHSLYLETLAELGPLGLVLAAAALGGPLLAAARLRSSAWGPPALAALVAYAVHAAVDFDWELAGVTLPFVVLGASAAVHASASRPGLAVRGRVLAAGGLAALAAAGILALAGSTRLAAASDAEAGRHFEIAAERARSALRFAPWSADAWLVIARSRLALGERSGARAAFRSAVGLDGSDWQTWSELAAVSSGEGRRAALAEAARLNPLVVPSPG